MSTQRQRPVCNRQTTEKEWLELALKSGEMGAWYWDLESSDKKIQRSEIYNRILELEPDEFFSRELWSRRIHPMDRRDVEAKVQAAISGAAQEYRAEYRILGKNGTFRWVRAQGRGIVDENGKVARLAGVVQDVTESKRLKHDHDHFVATLSHDLRNPLAAARANAELAKRYMDRKKQGVAELLDKSIAATERADRIIEDLLDASRAQAGQPITLVFESCNLRDALQGATDDLSLQFGDRFQFQAEGQFEGSWPRDILRRVLENLASNAIKYGARHRPVLIRLNRIEDTVTLSVHNEGNPVPKEEQSLLFELYHRSASAQASDQPGWGLGLTLVRAMANALRGHASVESSPDIGTFFRFEFPVRKV